MLFSLLYVMLFVLVCVWWLFDFDCWFDLVDGYFGMFVVEIFGLCVLGVVDGFEIVVCVIVG